MSRIIQVFLLVLFGLPIHAMAQKTAIKIVSELTNHTADSRESFLVTEIIGDDFYHIVENLSSQENFTLINFRDNKMEYYVSGEFMFVSSLDDWRLFQEEGELPFKVVKEHPNKTRTIHGREAMLVDLQVTRDELVREGWVDKKLFNKFKSRYGLELTEGMLEFSFEDLKMEYATLSVEEIEVTEELYSRLSSSAKESKEKGQALLASRDSLILELQEKEQKYYAKSISSFQQGMARIEKGQQAFYINSQGDKVFDEIVEYFHPYYLDVEEGAADNFNEDGEDRQVYHFIVLDNGRYKLVKKDGEPLHQGEYDKIEPRKLKGYLDVYQGKSSGIMDSWGKLLVPVKYEEVIPLNPRYFLIKDQGYYGVYDAEKQGLSIENQYEEVSYCGGCTLSYLLLKSNGKWGVISLEGEELLAFDYDHQAGTQKRADRWVSSLMKDGKKLLINLKTGKVLSRDEYEYTFILSKNLILYKKDGKFGLLKDTGEPLVQEQFDFILDRYLEDPNDYIKVFNRKEGLKVGLINQQGEWLLPIGEYDAADRYSNGYFSVKKEGKTALLDADQNLLLDFKYEFFSAELFSRQDAKGDLGHVFSFSDFQNTGLYFADTGRLIEARFSDIDKVYNADSTQVYFLAHQKTSSQDVYELYNSKGEVLIPSKYQRITHLTGDLFEIKQDNKYGLFDAKQSAVLLEPAFDFIAGFDDSHLSIRHGREQHLFHMPSKKFIMEEYSYFSATSEGELWVVGDETKGRLYDVATGEFKSQPFNHGNRSEWKFTRQLLAVGQDFTMGVINTEGEVIVPYEYNKAEVLANGYLRLVKEVSESKCNLYFADNKGKLIHKDSFSQHPYCGDYEGDPLVHNLLVTSAIDGDGETVYGLMDLKGNECAKPQYTNLQMRGNNGFIAQVKSLVEDDYMFTVGLLNNKGEEIIPSVFESVIFDVYEPLAGGDTIPVKLGEYYFYIDKQGQVLPFISRELGDGFW